jgi:hypothetical protein
MPYMLNQIDYRPRADALAMLDSERQAARPARHRGRKMHVNVTG